MIHETPLRIYFQDTDAGGIVYHSNYLDYAERARSEFLRAVGLSNQALIDRGVSFVIRQVEISYKAPARLEDLLIVRTQVAEVGHASMVMNQTVVREEQILVDMRLQVAFVDPKTLRPVRIPADLKELFLSCQKGE